MPQEELGRKVIKRPGRKVHSASTLSLVNEASNTLRASSFIHVNLDAVVHNIRILKGLAGPKTEMMGVVKGGAYGSGLMPVVNVMLEEGVKELCVATVGEGVYLRQHNVTVPITVFGNLVECEVEDVKRHHLIPSLSWTQPFTSHDKENLVYPDGSRLRVAINIDTGMSRYGVQPQDLPDLIHSLDQLEVTITSLYTHFQSGISEKKKNKRQLDLFLEATEPYLSRPLTRHAAATTGCVQGLGTDLDFIRPGGAITGLSSGYDFQGAEEFKQCEFRPAMSVVAKPSFYKLLPPGKFIGYDGTYKTEQSEWIANLTTGWSDGFSRCLSNNGAVRSIKTRELCPIVGRVSMDSITVKLSGAPDPDDGYLVISDDFHNITSAVGLARRLKAAVYEIPGKFSTRLPRIYSRGGKITQTFPSLSYTC
ncbi:hypothetical protein Pmani_007383 [Petrolisthes manimaculis]|uniref:Alanine racemase C-terminal domain-containing protein n=1 Tax=Petrolisthes manimaculis TaxID=1843537 RepID=A0AAE1UIS3_9EUCA|nr:hypothetical protein Pmani_007383 [Petrolisthes manimaculis]